MDDKVCVVTGAASGIGRAAALKLATSGAKAVVVADIDETGAKETVALIEASGATASAKLTDVEDADQIDELMQFAVDQYGSLDTLVNNVGVHEMYWTDKTTVDKLPLEIFEKVYRINLRSVFLATQAAAPHLRASTNDPSIVNAASTGSLTGYPGAGAYGSTKAAILQLTRVSAIDLSPDVRVNAFCPGTVDTAMVDRLLDGAADRAGIEKTMTATHLIPRMGAPEDVANLITFLASSEASWITGAAYTIDGGSLAWRGSR
ncbi:glucose 1-dehydrogenase [Rhodococcus jostii]|uniref:Glucose 1-dehydrogenase n=1 Tax=Rhodococcus jostii TaxID=132919 RepID=A0ABU4CSD3_RHOJO|nr:glucose 1-dehydrogenase [Rhodococcus jostii]MDV6286491.1 glucose 1-dehydrogenase [Rhodococcus jostii]